MKFDVSVIIHNNCLCAREPSHRFKDVSSSGETATLRSECTRTFSCIRCTALHTRPGRAGARDCNAGRVLPRWIRRMTLRGYELSVRRSGLPDDRNLRDRPSYDNFIATGEPEVTKIERQKNSPKHERSVPPWIIHRVVGVGESGAIRPTGQDGMAGKN